MHKSLSIFQQILVRKVKEVQNQQNKKVVKTFSPRSCVKPSSLEPTIIIENFELERNYFERSLSKKKKEQQIQKDKNANFSNALSFKRYGTFINAAIN